MRLALIALVLALVACGPGGRDNGGACVGEEWNSGTCDMGDMRECYTGHMDTQDVGPCTGGHQMCLASGVWGNCVGQVLPAPENCSDGVDNNCNGMVDEDVDADGDGFTTCGGDCCDSTECGSPALVNPTAFDVPGNNVDDDCNGTIDDTIAVCDVGIASNSNIAMDYARSIDLC